MPRPHPPPTPTSSTDLTAREEYQSALDMATSFALPPPALHSNNNHSNKQNTSPKKGTRDPTRSSQTTPPVSPNDRLSYSSTRHKRTLSGQSKLTDEPAASANHALPLPPPPSRARKIIQMKPKATSTSSSAFEASTHSHSQAQPPAKVTSTTSATAGTKRKQPSATSAAGRKIARKTAHSIIERRRRSKMNEEFGVLKDMIPACEGVEMHKLAILQAGIEYLRYLEGCIRQLKGEQEAASLDYVRQGTDTMDNDEDEDEDDDDDDDGDYAEEEAEQAAPKRPATQDISNWQMRNGRKGSVASWYSSSQPSPDVQPLQRTSSTQLPQQPQQSAGKPTLVTANSFTTLPQPFSNQPTFNSSTPTLLSPAFKAIHFSPDLARTGTNSSASTCLSVDPSTSQTSSSYTLSPNMLPLPQSTLSVNKIRELSNKSPALSEGGAEATATAALMMLTNDRRGGVEGGRGKGMSVKDLLSS